MLFDICTWSLSNRQLHFGVFSAEAACGSLSIHLACGAPALVTAKQCLDAALRSRMQSQRLRSPFFGYADIPGLSQAPLERRVRRPYATCEIREKGFAWFGEGFRRSSFAGLRTERRSLRGLERRGAVAWKRQLLLRATDPAREDQIRRLF